MLDVGEGFLVGEEVVQVGEGLGDELLLFWGRREGGLCLVGLLAGDVGKSLRVRPVRLVVRLGRFVDVIAIVCVLIITILAAIRRQMFLIDLVNDLNHPINLLLGMLVKPVAFLFEQVNLFDEFELLIGFSDGLFEIGVFL